MQGRFQRGFTLIELMIVVTIIGILATIAVPSYDLVILRTRRAELAVNLSAIRSLEEAYRAEWDVFTSCALAPPSIPGRTAVSFPATHSSSTDWNNLGWIPDHKVFGQYLAVANNLPGSYAHYVSDAYADIDGDGNLAQFQTRPGSRPLMLTRNDVF